MPAASLRRTARRRARAAVDVARRRRIERRLAGKRLLNAFADVNPRASFIEIGSNDGAQHDHLRSFIVEREWTGVMVEPVPYVFERLTKNYDHVDGVVLENAAIGATDGQLPFYFLVDAPDAERQTLPDWYDGIGSFSKDVVLSHASHIPDVDERLVCLEVPTLTFESLCARHGIERVDLLLTDTEGHDWEILQSVDLARWRPQLVVYEHYHLSPEARRDCAAHLEAQGYSTMEEGFDTFCLHDDAPRPLRELWDRLSPAVAGVAKYMEQPEPEPHPDLVRLTAEDRRYLTSLYDDTVPLPSGAAQALTEPIPELDDLRARYAALDLPVLSASRWNAEAVEDFLDLRYFRGETLITWHYRELPRISELKYFVFARYVQENDSRDVLSRCEEDGEFGCWTFSYPGYGRFSRDLLESANEINFLERELRLSEREEFSVLDIGAGYGRLAHRMTAAYPELRDYCCIDAVPESTFLSSYYLSHRGCAPPARVVPLDKADTDLAAGTFDLAVNIHSFPECTYAAVKWWLQTIENLRIPSLLIVPNEPTELLTLEADGSRRDFSPLIERAGYELVRREPVIADPAVRELLRLNDHFHLYSLR